MKPFVGLFLLGLLVPAAAQIKKPSQRRVTPVPTVIPTAMMVPTQVPPTPTPEVWHQEPVAFRNVPWGATEKEAQQILSTPMCLNIPTKIPNSKARFCKGYITLGSSSVEAYYSFLNDRFVSVSGTFDSDHYTTLKLAFTEKYGQPHSAKTSVVQNRMNASFEQEELVWEGSHIHIYLDRLGSKVTEGRFAVETQEYRRAVIKTLEDEAKKLKEAL